MKLRGALVALAGVTLLGGGALAQTSDPSSTAVKAAGQKARPSKAGTSVESAPVGERAAKSKTIEAEPGGEGRARIEGTAVEAEAIEAAEPSATTAEVGDGADIGDVVASPVEASFKMRQARRRAARLKLWKRISEVVEYPSNISLSLRTELMEHARRVARLRRAREVAAEEGDMTAAQRATVLIAMEGVRHSRALSELGMQVENRRRDTSVVAETASRPPAKIAGGDASGSRAARGNGEKGEGREGPSKTTGGGR